MFSLEARRLLRLLKASLGHLECGEALEQEASRGFGSRVELLRRGLMVGPQRLRERAVDGIENTDLQDRPPA